MAEVLSSDNVPANLDAGRNGSPMLKVADGLEQVAVQQGASPCWPVILFLGFDA